MLSACVQSCQEFLCTLPLLGQRIALDEVPFAWLVVPQQIEAFRKRIQDFTPSPLESRAWGLLNAWIA